MGPLTLEELQRLAAPWPVEWLFEPRPGDLAGHSPDHGARLVLHENLAAGRANLLAAAQTIVTHAGQHPVQFEADDAGAAGGLLENDDRLAHGCRSVQAAVRCQHGV